MNARFPDGVEMRSAAAELRTGAGRVLAGYAAVWDSPAKIGGAFEEVVRRGAFTASLASGAPIYLLAQHDWAQPLSKTGHGLVLREDARGLAFEATLPETRAADDTLAGVRAGIVSGASFAFRVPDGGDFWATRDKRELRQVELIEVSAVTIGAYSAATVSARAMSRGAGRADACARLRRLRLLEL